MEKIRISVLASGRGSNLQAIIDSIEKGYIKNARIVIVISDRENAYALERARKHKIPAKFVNPKKFQSKDDYESEILKILEERKIDLICLAGYMRLVGKNILNKFKGRIMNIHPSLLPSFPGTHAQKDALEYAVKISGATVHFVDEGIDTGPIIIQACVAVFDDDTVETLSERILKEEHRIYPLAIKLFLKNYRRVKIKND